MSNYFNTPRTVVGVPDSAGFRHAVLHLHQSLTEDNINRAVMNIGAHGVTVVARVGDDFAIAIGPEPVIRKMLDAFKVMTHALADHSAGESM